MSCCNACARLNPPHARPNPSDVDADLQAIDQAYERLGHYWMVGSVMNAAGYPAGGDLESRIRGLVGEPLNLSDLETAGLAGGAARAWKAMASGAKTSLKAARRNRYVFTVGALVAAGSVVSWRALDLGHEAALKTVEQDGQRLEALFNKLPENERAQLLQSWGTAHFGRDLGDSGLSLPMLVLGGIGILLVVKAVRS